MMNQRLIWNFEINPVPPLNWDRFVVHEADELKWEARFFWPEQAIITLAGLSEDCLDLTSCRIKHREDEYLLLPRGHDNIKRREGKLLYKPQLACKDNIYAFDKKINLTDLMLETLDPEHPLARIKTACHQNVRQISVHKSAIVCALPTALTIKLELSRLRLLQTIYYSACIEGRSQHLVKTIAKELFGNKSSTDYAHFLRTIQP